MTNSSLHPTRCALDLRIRGEGEGAKTALPDVCAACCEPVFEMMPIDAGSLNIPGHLNVLTRTIPLSIQSEVFTLMNDTNKNNTRWFLKSAGLIAGIFAVLGMIGCSSKPTVPAPPIPKGDTMIHVEFKKLSDDEFNKLTDFVRKLAESHSAPIKGSTTGRDVGDYNAYIGLWKDGVIDQVYTPDHPIPSPEIEASMKAELEAYLRGKGIDVGGVNLELRYGP